MGLRSFLDRPDGGQIFSAVMVVVLLVAFEAVVMGHILLALKAGHEVQDTDIMMMVLTGAVIGSAVNFVRKRHGAR